MIEKLKKYLDEIFLPYEDTHVMKEMKEELFIDLQEKLKDLKSEGYDEHTAYQKTIDSIGEISELVESMNVKKREMKQIVGMDFSKSNLQNSDFSSVSIHGGKFNYSNLKNSDFSYSDLTNSSFKASDLENVNFEHTNLTGVKIVKSALKGASFKGSILDKAEFSYSDLSKVNFDNQTFKGTIFHYTGLKGTSFRNAVFQNVSFKTDVKKANFDGATMDKITYALLKGYKANLENVKVV